MRVLSAKTNERGRPVAVLDGFCAGNVPPGTEYRALLRVRVRISQAGDYPNADVLDLPAAILPGSLIGEELERIE
jgi:hypothetical protein